MHDDTLFVSTSATGIRAAFVPNILRESAIPGSPPRKLPESPTRIWQLVAEEVGIQETYPPVTTHPFIGRPAQSANGNTRRGVQRLRLTEPPRGLVTRQHKKVAA